MAEEAEVDKAAEAGVAALQSHRTQERREHVLTASTCQKLSDSGLMPIMIHKTATERT